MNPETLKLIQTYPELLQAFLNDNDFAGYVASQAQKIEEAKLQATIDAGKEAEAKLSAIKAGDALINT